MPFTKMRNSCAQIFSKAKKLETERSFMYNVIPEYKAYTKSQIIEKNKQNSLPYAVCFQSWTNDFNIASGIRSASALGASHIYYMGSKRIDKRGSCGCHQYKDVTWIEDEDHLIELNEKYSFIGVDKLEKSISIEEFDFSRKNNMYIFGCEGEGILPSVLDMCESFIHISQRGSVPSLNVASASTVIMHYAEKALGASQPVIF